MKNGGYIIIYIGGKILIAEIIAMYRKNSNYHSYVDCEVINVDALSYISMRVFFPLQYCLFTSLDSQRFTYNILLKI